MSGPGGKHNPDDVMIGMLDSPEMKALAELVTESDGESTFSDWLRRMIMDRATAHGIMINGKVNSQFREELVVRAAVIRQAKREKSEARKAARAAKEKISKDNKDDNKDKRGTEDGE